MTDPTEAVSGLIERIEAGGGPDRELDARICIALGLSRDNVMVGVDGWCINSATNPSPYLSPTYTASFDAAISLIPRGWIVEIRRYFNSDGEYVAAVDLTDSGTVGRGCHPEEELTLQSRIVERRQGVDPTPAAITAAALRARETTPSIKGGDRG